MQSAGARCVWRPGEQRPGRSDSAGRSQINTIPELAAIGRGAARLALWRYVGYRRAAVQPINGLKEGATARRLPGRP